MKRPRILGAALTLGLLLALAAPSAAYARPGSTVRVSVASDGSEGTTATAGLVTKPDSLGAALSASNRYVAFSSAADNLVPGDIDQLPDVFVHDRATGKTELVSVSWLGGAAVGKGFGSSEPSISANGRYVAFASDAVNLVPGDTNLHTDIFVRDRLKHVTTLVSISSRGAQGNGDSTRPSIDAAGDAVAFESMATNLTHEKSTGGVFLREMKRGSRGSTVMVAPQGWSASISGNGRYVAFYSSASDLVQGDTNGRNDVFVFDRKDHSMVAASVTPDGATGNGYSVLDTPRALSANGRYLVFESLASDLVPNDANSRIAVDGEDVFLRDLRTHRTQRISVGPDGEEIAPMDAVEKKEVIDASGRYVAYQTEGAVSPQDQSDGLYPIANQALWDVYVFDRVLGIPEPMSMNIRGQLGTACAGPNPPAHATDPALGSGGQIVAFSSCAPDVVGGDHNGAYDVFVRDRGPNQGVGALSSGRSSAGSACSAGAACIGSDAIVVARDPAHDLSRIGYQAGADLRSTLVAYRPQLGDVFARLEVQVMPRFALANPALVYGLDLRVHGVRYEVRAAKTGMAASFGLFRRNAFGLWTKVADLRGGYGTTGEEVVFSLPLQDFEARSGASLSHVSAFTALGTFATGAVVIVDRATLGRMTRIP